LLRFVFASSLAILGRCSSPRSDARLADAPQQSSPSSRAPAALVAPSSANAAAVPSPARAAASAEPAPTSRAIEPGSADLDPDNDAIVAPPAEIPDCLARLQAEGVRVATASLPVHSQASGVVCGTAQAIVYHGREGGVRFTPSPVVSCGLGLALARFESVAEREVERHFGVGLKSVEQGGTYNCRKMARFRGMVSEHSYANAIDIYAFRLADGRRISVAKDFGRPQVEPTSVNGRFLRSLARTLYDEGVFSVVLTEYFDALHRDHLHLDLARYRVDGTR
jgi:hypothetical protein